MRKTIYASLVIFVCLANKVLAEPPPGEHHNIAADAIEIHAMPLRQGQYIKLGIDADLPLADVVIEDSKGQRVRQLTLLPSRSATLQMVAESADDYRLKVVNADSDNRYVIRRVTVSRAEQHAAQQSPASPRLRALEARLQQGGSTEAFWQDMQTAGTPLVEPLENGVSLVTFLWRGDDRNVRLFGSPSGDHEPLKRLGESDVWYGSFTVPNDTRLSYQLAPDLPTLPGSARRNRVAIKTTTQQDPLNKTPWALSDKQDRFTTLSLLDLPGATVSPWTEEKGNPAGTVATHVVKSQLLNNSREIALYTPTDFLPTQHTPVLFFFDSLAYRTKVPTPLILDNLIAAGSIPPSIAVFVANPSAESRARELPCNSDFAAFMAKELLPWVEHKTGVESVPEYTLLSGASYGGLASACIAYRYPEQFGIVVSQSGSFWWHPDFGSEAFPDQGWLPNRVAQSDPVPVRFYLNAGLF